MGPMNRRVACAFFAAAFSVTTAPHAEDEGSRANAQMLFDEAKTLIFQGNWVDACPKLAKSNELEPRSTTLFRLGECYEHTGRRLSAVNAYAGAAAGATAAGETKRAEFARERAAKLEASLPRIG